MGAFELENECLESTRNDEACIIAMKIFDQCRSQICLTPEILGPARAAETSLCQCEQICEGDIIVPPANATSVSISNFKLAKICITNKTPNAFRSGYWDVEVKYVFTYTLTFSADCMPIYTIKAKNSYQTKLTLFGSIECDVLMSTDFCGIDTTNVNGGPFVTVEAKAIPLSAVLSYPNSGNCHCECTCTCTCGPCNPCPSPCPDPCSTSCCDPCSSCCNTGCCDPCTSCCNTTPSCGCGNSGNNCGYNNISPATSVSVTIGLFSIVKLFRFTNVKVPCCGCCVPEECSAQCSTNQDPCDYFNNLSFPLSLFCPPDCHETKKCKPSKKPSCGCC